MAFLATVYLCRTNVGSIDAVENGMACGTDTYWIVLRDVDMNEWTNE